MNDKTIHQFGGLGHLFKCKCGCSRFIRVDDIKPGIIEMYECENCHEWYTKNKKLPDIQETILPVVY